MFYQCVAWINNVFPSQTKFPFHTCLSIILPIPTPLDPHGSYGRGLVPYKKTTPKSVKNSNIYRTNLKDSVQQLDKSTFIIH